jgi:hypothetical protein
LWIKRSGLIVVLTLSLASVAYCSSWTWSEQTVDSQPGKFTSITSDKDGNLHLVYSSDSQQFKYAFRPAGDNHWYVMPIADGYGFTQITTDSNGNAHVCLATHSASIIKYGYFENSKWQFQQIAPGTGPVWYSCSVAISADGTPHVAWYQEKGPDLNVYGHYKYAVQQNGVWVVRTIDTDPLTGKWHDMLIDSKGRVHISNDCFVNGELHYATEDGGQWHITMVDSRRLDASRPRDTPMESLGMGNSMLLDNHDLAHFSYETDTALKYATQTATGFLTETVDSIRPLGSWVGYHTALVLDQHGNPHIAYEDAGTLKHAFWDGTQWRVQVLSPSGTDVYRYLSMTIDKFGVIYISFRDSEDGSVKVKIGKSTDQMPSIQPSRIVSSSIEVDKAMQQAARPQ